jgi:complex iron-sulfur molybdoenzyme family reductase subunit gamma
MKTARAWFRPLLAAVLISPPALSFARDGDSFSGQVPVAGAGARSVSVVIPVRRSTGEPVADPLHDSWLKQEPVTVSVYPQVSVPPAAAPAAVATVSVRARYSDKVLALHLEWADDNASAERGIGRFADAAAVQWPVRYGPGVALPYIGMGQRGSPVALWFWRADGSVETLAAEGFGTLTAQPDDGVKARAVWKDGKWRAVFTRGLNVAGPRRVSLAPGKLGAAPVAFATWSGDAAERNGLKRLSAWQVLQFERGAPADAYVKQLTAVLPAGNAESGKRLMAEKGCIGCHSFPGNPAQPRIGPDLTYAGGMHTAAYLRESLTEPSRVIVPGKGYSMEQGGKRVSIMPPFAGTEEERRDVLVYLRGLR